MLFNKIEHYMIGYLIKNYDLLYKILRIASSQRKPPSYSKNLFEYKHFQSIGPLIGYFSAIVLCDPQIEQVDDRNYSCMKRTHQAQHYSLHHQKVKAHFAVE